MTAATTRRSTPVDGFSLTYDDTAPDDGGGHGPTVVLLHGWPGHRRDYDRVLPLLDGVRTVVPDLRGFGDSDRHDLPPDEAYTTRAQLRSVLGLLDELGIGRAVFAGYDVGARLIGALVAKQPERLAAAAVTPPLPGAGRRLLEPTPQREFWYQAMHRLPVADTVFDGRPDAVRAYLTWIWTHWAGGTMPLDETAFDRLVDQYARPGAFTSSIAWYRGRPPVSDGADEQPPAQPSDVPLEIVWPDGDPLFPVAWADRLDEWFADAHLVIEPGCGHFVPVQAPQSFAAAVHRAVGRAR